MFTNQHIQKEDRKLTRVSACKSARGLLFPDPVCDDRVGRIGSRFIKEGTDRRKCLPDRHHQTMQFENIRTEHRLQEIAGDLRQLRFYVARGVDIDRMCDVDARLPDNSFEQALLATEDGV